MEKVGDSQSSLGPVVPTSDKKMKRQLRELKVEAESLETCLEKIRGVLKKLRETGDIKDWFPETDGTVLVLGYVDPETLRTELENEAGVAIKSITGATTNSSHIGEDGTVTQIVRTEKLCMPYKIPRMDSPEFDDDRPTEILNHSENPMEHGNNSQWRSRGVMANDLERGDATGSEFPNEVSDNPKVTLNRSEKTTEFSKNPCSIL